MGRLMVGALVVSSLLLVLTVRLRDRWVIYAAPAAAAGQKVDLPNNLRLSATPVRPFRTPTAVAQDPFAQLLGAATLGSADLPGFRPDPNLDVYETGWGFPYRAAYVRRFYQQGQDGSTPNLWIYLVLPDPSASRDALAGAITGGGVLAIVRPNNATNVQIRGPFGESDVEQSETWDAPYTDGTAGSDIAVAFLRGRMTVIVHYGRGADADPAQLQSEAHTRAAQEDSKLLSSTFLPRFLLLSPPNSPSDLRAIPVDEDTIELDWTSNSGDEDGFAVYDLAARQIVTNVPSGVTSYMLVGLDPNTEYCAYVYAFNAAGASAPSNSACAATRP